METLEELSQLAIESFAVCRRAAQSYESGSPRARRFIPDLADRLRLLSSGMTFLCETIKSKNGETNHVIL